MKANLRVLHTLRNLDSVLAAAALVLMALIPLVEILLRPLAGSGIDNASVIVQHLGLVMAMLGSVAALRHGHLSSFGKGFASPTWPRLAQASQRFGLLFAALVCGVLCMASWRLVDSERPVAQLLAYGMPVWWLQASMPLGFAWLGLQPSHWWQACAGALGSICRLSCGCNVTCATWNSHGLVTVRKETSPRYVASGCDVSSNQYWSFCMFKKTAIAFALAALAAPSFAAEFAVGTDTKFEVNVDVAAYYQTIKDAKGETSQAQLLGSGLNQIEIKATRSIDDDLSVFGEIEVDYDPIIDNNPVQTDDTRFGIASKKYGRFTVGQFDSYFEDNIIEALGVSHGDKAFVTEPASSNDGRHLQYSHKLGDLAFAVDLTANNNAANNSAGNDGNHGAAIAASYQLGAFGVGLGYSDLAKYKSDTGATNTAKNVTGLTASYKFGSTKLIGLVVAETATDVLKNAKTNYTGVAVTHVMGAFDIGVAFQNRETSTKTYGEWSLGLGYTPFKNMVFFLDVAGLNDTKDKGDIMEIGGKYTF
jgi:TRAP-type C4-dicarboxylate transport system permease small subunit